jgi:copper(I)-binding protein
MSIESRLGVNDSIFVQIVNSNVVHAIAIACVLFLVALCPAQAADISVTGGWFRALPSSVPSGGYFTVHNHGKERVTLTDVESPACTALMMHQTTAAGMDHVMKLDIGSGEKVAFTPGGYHLMCLDSKPMLKPGATVPVTLKFEDGQNVTAPFQVRSATGK